MQCSIEKRMQAPIHASQVVIRTCRKLREKLCPAWMRKGPNVLWQDLVADGNWIHQGPAKKTDIQITAFTQMPPQNHDRRAWEYGFHLYTSGHSLFDHLSDAAEGSTSLIPCNPLWNSFMMLTVKLCCSAWAMQTDATSINNLDSISTHWLLLDGDGELLRPLGLLFAKAL